MKKTIILLAVFFALNPFNHVAAHGIHMDYSFDYPLVTLKIYFSKSSPVAHADVTVFSPISGELFLSGKTDKDGNFEFTPDVPGKWTVKVDDGMGHRKTSVITIEDFSDQLVSEQAHTEEEAHSHDHAHIPGYDHGHCHIPVAFKIIFGLSLIFGAAGVWYGLKARKK